MELKAITTEWDEQKKRVAGDKEWCGFLDCVQHLLRASSIPVRLTHLLCYILAIHHVLASSGTILAKVLVVGQKKSLEAAA